MGDGDPKQDKGKGKEKKVSENEDGYHFLGASASVADAPRFVNLPRGHQGDGGSSFRADYVLRLQAPASGNSLSVQPRRSGFKCLLCRLPFGACSCRDDQFPDNPGQNAPRPAAPVVLGLPPPPEPHHQPPPPVGAPLPVGAGLQQLEDQPAVAAESPKMGECDEGKEKEKTFENENGNRSSGAFGATAGNPAAGSTPIVNLPPLGHQQPGVNSFRGGHGFQFQLQPSAAGNSPLQLQRNPRQNARPFEPVLKQATISSVVCLVCGLPFGSCACWDDQFLDNPTAPVVGAGVLHLGGDATQLKHLVPPADQPGPSNEGLKCSACRYHPVRLTAQPRRHICVCASCRSGGIFCSVCNFGP